MSTRIAAQQRVGRDYVPSTRPVTGRKVLIWLLSFFGVVMAVNIIFMKLALQTLPGVVTESSYRVGNAYNKDITAARQQETLHWSVGLHVERRVDGTAMVKVDAKDAEGKPLNGLTFRVVLRRPTDVRADAQATLNETGNGLYRGTAQDVLAGVWDVMLFGERNGETLFQSHNRVILD
jgi:nitrogen fixation protein FixH